MPNEAEFRFSAAGEPIMMTQRDKSRGEFDNKSPKSLHDATTIRIVCICRVPIILQADINFASLSHSAVTTTHPAVIRSTMCSHSLCCMAHGLVYLRVQSMVMPVLAITSQVSAIHVYKTFMSPLFFFLLLLFCPKKEHAGGREKEDSLAHRRTDDCTVLYSGNVTNELQIFLNRKVHAHYEPDLAVVDG